LLVNSFCSTETGPMCLYFLDKATEVAGTSVPAGFPVDGMEVLVLNEHGNQVGSNQPGEIAVKSRYLSSGYWGRPEDGREIFLRTTNRRRAALPDGRPGTILRRWLLGASWPQGLSSQDPKFPG